eukprot:4510719-Pleurochrysis_carterae.AAC.5
MLLDLPGGRQRKSCMQPRARLGSDSLSDGLHAQSTAASLRARTQAHARKPLLAPRPLSQESFTFGNKLQARANKRWCCPAPSRAGTEQAARVTGWEYAGHCKSVRRSTVRKSPRGQRAERAVESAEPRGCTAQAQATAWAKVLRSSAHRTANRTTATLEREQLRAAGVRCRCGRWCALQRSGEGDEREAWAEKPLSPGQATSDSRQDETAWP